MARQIVTGFEIGIDTGGSNALPDGNTGSGTSWAIDTSVKKTGASSLKSTSGGPISPHQIFGVLREGVNAGCASIAFWYRKTGNPVSNAQIVQFVNTLGSVIQFSAWILSTGVIRCAGGATGQVDSASSMPNDTWTHIEIRASASSATGGTIELLVNEKSAGTAAATWGDMGTYNAYINFTTLDSPPTQSSWFDDFIVDTVSGTGSAVAIGAASVALLKPISDNQVGSWRGGASGTSNLWDGVDNTPPVGLASASATNTSQIESADNSGDNATDEYRVNLTTYAGAGITLGSQIRSAFLWINHGEDINTGTKNITAGLHSNPTGSLPTPWDVTLGTTGEIGTWPTGWRWTELEQTANFSGVDVSASPVVNLRKTDTTTRVASVDFIGMYVEFIRRSNPARRRRFPMSVLNH